MKPSITKPNMEGLHSNSTLLAFLLQWLKVIYLFNSRKGEKHTIVILL